MDLAWITEKNKHIGRPLKPGLPAERERRKRHSARKRVQYAIKTGKLIKPKHCEYSDCLEKEVFAHHPDYSNPLDVLWFCRAHHVEADKAAGSKFGRPKN